MRSLNVIMLLSLSGKVRFTSPPDSSSIARAGVGGCSTKFMLRIMAQQQIRVKIMDNRYKRLFRCFGAAVSVGRGLLVVFIFMQRSP